MNIGEPSLHPPEPEKWEIILNDEINEAVDKVNDLFEEEKIEKAVETITYEVIELLCPLKSYYEIEGVKEEIMSTISHCIWSNIDEALRSV